MDIIYLTVCLLIFVCVAFIFGVIAKFRSTKVWILYWVLLGAWGLFEVGSFALWESTECSAPKKYANDVVVDGFLSSEESLSWVRQELKNGFRFVERRESTASTESFIRYEGSGGESYEVIHSSSRKSEVEEKYTTEFVQGRSLRLTWELLSSDGDILGRAVDAYYYGSRLRQLWVSTFYPEFGTIQECLTIGQFRKEFLVPGRG